MKKLLFAIAAMLCTLSTSAKSYKVGDLYNENGLKGIVVRVDASGEHGLIMSLQKCSKKWLDDKAEKFNTGAFFEDDGEKNMVSIENYIKENGKSWDMFPFFEWCRSLGEGWYAPAKEELKDILKAINGTEGKYDAKYMAKVTKLIKKQKGDGLIDSGFGALKTPYTMLSSTEMDGGMVHAIQFNQNMSSALLGGTPKGKLEISVWTKTQGGKMVHLGSRAVHKF